MMFPLWRDPDSNRGHHDFQAGAKRRPDCMKVLQIGLFLVDLAAL
jgi:hypothetical protein